MFTQKGILQRLRREERRLLQQQGFEKEWRKLRSRFKKERQSEIHLYEDSCPEFYEGPLYVAEVISELPDGLEYVAVNKDIDGVIRELEDYLNE